MAKFPPLPDTIYGLFFESGDAFDGDATYQEFVDERGYTATQLRARDLEIWRMATQEAKKVCELQASIQDSEQRAVVAHCCAAAIRALPEPGHE